MKKTTITLSLLIIAAVFISWKQEVPKEKMARGKKVYDQYCLSCHMDNGEGVPRMNPSLVKSKYITGTKTELIKIILLGSDAFAGESNRPYKNLMAPMDNLSDQEISDVSTYVRNSFGNKGTVITPGDVKYVRTRIQ